MARLLGLLSLLFATSFAPAQNNLIQWRRDPAAAIAEAQQAKRPLLVYVLASERYRDNQLDREQKRSFKDPRVMRRVRNFIPLRLSRAQHRNILDQFGFSQQANMVMAFMTPEGEQLGRLSATGIAQADSLAQKLEMVYEAYGKKIFDEEVRPKFDNEKTKSNELRQALQLVSDYNIKAADKSVIALLERERLNATVRKAVYETLVALGTKTALDKLLELGQGGDEAAAKALQRCTPAAAELMLSHLKADAEPFDYLAYQTVTRICRVPKPKPERYFENSSQRLKEGEIQRVSEQVRAVAQRWKELND